MFRILLLIVSLLSFIGNANAAGQIRAVGSSTVYPFVTVIAEEFGRKTAFKTPVVESTGTGGGFKLFCLGSGDGHPDISNASRAIKNSEKELCKKNGVNNVVEVKIGYDGIVIANSKASKKITLSTNQVFKALGRKVPKDGKLIDNPYKKWNQIDSSLPDIKIEVYGPPPTSGTRDAFVELVMEKACKNRSEFKAAYPDKKERKKACHLIREDGHFIEAGENDNLIVQKLLNNTSALGIFGYSFLDQNMENIQASVVDGYEASFANISNGNYPVSRPLFVYVKGDHVDVTPGLKDFVKELISDNAIGSEGYLSYKGLIPLPNNEKEKLQENVKTKINF